MERLQGNKRRRRRWGSYCRSSVIWRRRSRRTRVCPETPPDWALCDPVSPLLFLLVAFSLFLRQQQPRDTGFENAPTSSSERSDIECSERGREGGREAEEEERAREEEPAFSARPGSALGVRRRQGHQRDAPRPGARTPAAGGGAARRDSRLQRPALGCYGAVATAGTREPGSQGLGVRAGVGDGPREARLGAVGRTVFPAELRSRTESFCTQPLQRVLPSPVPVAHGEAPPRGSPPLNGEGPSSPLPRRPPQAREGTLVTSPPSHLSLHRVFSFTVYLGPWRILRMPLGAETSG